MRGAALAASALLAACASDPGPARVGMTLDRLHELLAEESQVIERRGGAWELRAGGVSMACFTDATHDRMRLVAPIARARELTGEQRERVLEANFHSALDARYATSGGVLYAAFIHPLSPLTDDEVRSAVAQVASLVHTFGTTYSSGELVFGGS